MAPRRPRLAGRDTVRLDDAGATVLHWNKFRHGSVPFLLWFWIYVVTAVLVPAVWLTNRGQHPGTPEDPDAELPRAVRGAMAVAGVAVLAVAAWMYLFPASAISAWPWLLTLLTARAVAAFVALPGVGWLVIASDPRWSSARVMLGTEAIGLGLLLIAVARARREFDHGTRDVRLRRRLSDAGGDRRPERVDASSDARARSGRLSRFATASGPLPGAVASRSRSRGRP